MGSRSFASGAEASYLTATFTDCCPAGLLLLLIYFSWYSNQATGTASNNPRMLPSISA